MGPRPYSDKSLPVDSSIDIMTGIPSAAFPDIPPALSETTTPSPTLQEQVLIEPLVDNVIFQETNRISDFEFLTPCYPTPGDIMPYDHSLPDFIKQITNQSNLSNLHSLSLRVISTLISLHRMSTYLPNLTELNLEGSILNSLRDIGCNFKNLQVLKVGHCQLESLDGTFGLSSLKELYAQENFINDVSPCSNLPHIRHIDVSSNRIRNISYAGFLSVCKKLRSIVFTGNPATEAPDYRKHVRRILPQIETLDDISFINEENLEECKESEAVENYCGESDSSSTGVPDVSSVSPSESMNNFFEPEDLLHLDKKNKQVKNLADQDQCGNVDNEMKREELSEIKRNLQIQDDFQNLNLSKVKRKILDKANIMENKNINMKQKCTSLQKLDKDIKNRTKKSNLFLHANITEEIISPPDFSERDVLEGSSFCSLSPSTPISKVNTEGLDKIQTSENQSVKSSTTSGFICRESIDMKAEEIKLGTIKKSSSIVSKSKISGEEQLVDRNRGPSTLTTGLPICGNLTAALRTRKKIQNFWDESQNYLSQKFGSQSEVKAAKGGTKEENQMNVSGERFDIELDTANEDDLIEDDVLATSKKWREAFRRFRSNNRTKWEEDELDQKNVSREEAFSGRN